MVPLHTMNSLIGVAISTTGDEHRLPLLHRALSAWREYLPLGSVLVVTVDGSLDKAARVYDVVREGPNAFGMVLRAGQPEVGLRWGPEQRRLGVAVNKNTGIEALMAQPVEHVFLADDDTWPKSAKALTLHTRMADTGIKHSMVCWGAHRLGSPHYSCQTWTWPRGVVLYTHRSAIERAGGMVEAFGPGGHEHVEWSRRIHNSGLIPAPFVSPRAYALDNAMGARRWWHAEDMRRPGETTGAFRLRKRDLTSIHRAEGDWDRINDVMFRQEGKTDFVPYTAVENGRASATLCTTPSQGAGEEA